MVIIGAVAFFALSGSDSDGSAATGGDPTAGGNDASFDEVDNFDNDIAIGTVGGSSDPGSSEGVTGLDGEEIVVDPALDPAPIVTTTTTTMVSAFAPSTVLSSFGQFGPQMVDADGVATSGPDGSGCEPGGTSLPDGLWYVRMTSAAADGSSIEVDLQCRYSGDNVDLYVGDAADDDEWDFGDELVVNDSETLRTVPVADNGVFYPGYCFFPDQREGGGGQLPGADATDTLAQMGTSADPYQGAYLDTLAVWLLIKDGAATEIVDGFYRCAG